MNQLLAFTIDAAKPDQARAQLRFVKAEGNTVIDINMTLPNQFAHQSVLQVQAELLRMAAEDLAAEHRRLSQHIQAGSTSAS